MSLCKLTTGRDGSVWINPTQVIAIQQYRAGTVIITTGTGEGRPFRIFVTESPEDVASRLDLHAQSD
jgi:hypothetical protein